jgi:hypothetical protein
LIEVLTALLVAITGFYAWATFRILRANEQVVSVMQEQSEAINRPYIAVSTFLMPRSVMIYLKIENIGKTAAHDLHLTLDRDFYKFGRSGTENNLATFSAFTQPIKTFPPGAQLVFPLAQAFVVFDEEANSEATPRVFNINATYSYLHRTVFDTTTIDLNPYLKSQPDPDPILDRLDAMVKSLETMARAGQEMSVSLRNETANGEHDMSRTLTISDALYDRLESSAHMRGMTSIEQLLEEWQAREDELLRRQDVVRQIDALRERLFATYGELPDSVVFIREDRER